MYTAKHEQLYTEALEPFVIENSYLITIPFNGRKIEYYGNKRRLSDIEIKRIKNSNKEYEIVIGLPDYFSFHNRIPKDEIKYGFRYIHFLQNGDYYFNNNVSNIYLKSSFTQTADGSILVKNLEGCMFKNMNECCAFISPRAFINLIIPESCISTNK